MIDLNKLTLGPPQQNGMKTSLNILSKASPLKGYVTVKKLLPLVIADLVKLRSLESLRSTQRKETNCDSTRSGRLFLRASF